jgi:preprotein translocase subunit SecE
MNFIQKYIKQVVVELKKVSWPTKEQTINQTLLVIIVSVVAAIYIGGVDYLLQQLMLALAN